MKNILCFGDSNTHGFRTCDCGRFSEDIRWTGLLQKKLGTSYNIISEGLNGRTTVFNDPIEPFRCGADYLIPCVLSHRPLDLLIIMLGTNDVKDRFSASAACIAIGLKQLCLQAMQSDCWKSRPNILVVAPVPLLKNVDKAKFGKTFGVGGYEKSIELAAEYELICKELNLHFLNANGCEIDIEDCIHLTTVGHGQLSSLLCSIVNECC